MGEVGGVGDDAVETLGQRFVRCVDFSDSVFLAAALVIWLAPTIWNILGRIEHRLSWISRVCGNSKRAGCYLLAAWIFGFSLYRDWLVVQAMDVQKTLDDLGEPEVVVAATLVGVLAAAVLLGSYVQLGITGTYLGDYFGILMEEKVSGFPFNVSSHPMYDASTALFLVKAILARSPAGIVLSVWVYVVYQFYSHYFEGPFTDYIYSQKNTRSSNKKRK